MRRVHVFFGCVASRVRMSVACGVWRVRLSHRLHLRSSASWAIRSRKATTSASRVAWTTVGTLFAHHLVLPMLMCTRVHKKLRCICGTHMEYNAATQQCDDNDSAPELVRALAWHDVSLCGPVLILAARRRGFIHGQGDKTVFVQMLDTNKWGTGLYVMCAASCPSVDFQLLCRDTSAPNGVLVRAWCAASRARRYSHNTTGWQWVHCVGPILVDSEQQHRHFEWLPEQRWLRLDSGKLRPYLRRELYVQLLRAVPEQHLHRVC